jgi:hypothetical protein
VLAVARSRDPSSAASRVPCDQYLKWYVSLALFGTLGLARLRGINAS